MLCYTFDSSEEAMLVLARDVLERGHERVARDQKSWDTDATFELTNPRARFITNEARGFRPGYAAASLAWNLAQRDDIESICLWNPNGARISDDGKTFYGANYGHRWAYGLSEALEVLKADPNSRRAWVPIWDQERDYVGGYSLTGKDVPCTLGFSLRIHDGLLEMHVIMRSQAVLGVMPYDVFLFTAMQELIANQLGIAMGAYKHTCLSAHVYERELKWLDAIKDAPMDADARVMPQIGRTLTKAEERWPEVFDWAIGNGLGTIYSDVDPIEVMMTSFAPVLVQ